MRHLTIATLIVFVPLTGGCGLIHAGTFAAAPSRTTSCAPIEGFSGGTEDIAVDYDQRRIFVSADDRRGRPAHEGAVYTMTFEDIAERRAPTLATSGVTNFHPHGIGLWAGDNETRRLFVVNHPEGAPSRVEIFDIRPDGALHFSGISLQWPEVHRPNDVVAVGPSNVFVTNERDVRLDPATRAPGAGDFWSALTGRDDGAVFYADEHGATRVVRGIDFANGIVVTPDGRHIWVAETGEGNVRIYRRSGSKELLLERTLDVGVGPDNLVASEDGRIWVAAHNNLLAFLRHRTNESALSQSRAFAVTLDGRLLPERIYPDPAELSAASVAAEIDGEVVMGGVYRGRLLVCSRAGEGMHNTW